MRVLAVTNMYPTGDAPSAGTFVEQQIASVRQVGLDVQMMFLDRIKRGMSVYLGIKPEIRAKIADFRPDIVHVMYGGIMAYQVTKAVSDRPTVVTFHGSDLLGDHLSGSVRKLIANVGVWASRRAARWANAIVLVSKTLQDKLPKDVDRTKVRIIPCGVDLDRFKPLNRDKCREQLGWNADRFHVLFPDSSNDPVKRPNLARAAVDAFMRFGIRAEMHKLHGVPNSDVPTWLNASDVLLLTSLHEGSPTIVKEGLACNLPVVSVDVGDVRERIQRIGGCYLASADPDDLAYKLCQVYVGPRRVLGRVKVQELSLTRVALLLKKLYEEVLIS